MTSRHPLPRSVGSARPAADSDGRGRFWVEVKVSIPPLEVHVMGQSQLGGIANKLGLVARGCETDGAMQSQTDSACIQPRTTAGTLAAGCVLELGLEQLVESGVETGKKCASNGLACY